MTSRIAKFNVVEAEGILEQDFERVEVEPNVCLIGGFFKLRFFDGADVGRGKMLLRSVVEMKRARMEALGNRGWWLVMRRL